MLFKPRNSLFKRHLILPINLNGLKQHVSLLGNCPSQPFLNLPGFLTDYSSDYGTDLLYLIVR